MEHTESDYGEARGQAEVQATEVYQGNAEVRRLRRDAAGVLFDPLKHVVDASGEPLFRSDGKFRKKKRIVTTDHLTEEIPPAQGPTMNGTAASGEIPPDSLGLDVSPIIGAEDIEKIKSSATLSAELLFLVAQSAGGERWKPKATPIDERLILTDAFQKYYTDHGIVEIPSGVYLCVALSLYAVPRLAEVAMEQGWLGTAPSFGADIIPGENNNAKISG